MLEFKKPDRVELIECSDPDTQLQPGDLGTVQYVDGLGTVHVDWDRGIKLGMVLDHGDVIRHVATADGEQR